jgi:putative CocE/NonD family hydrolase
LLGPQTCDAFSPSSYLDRAKQAAVPTLGLSGWFDAAYPHAAIKRHLSLGDPRNKLVLGPWNHGVSQNVSPHAARPRPAFDLDAELLRFFDHHLLANDTGITTEATVRYYVMGAETWRTAPSWPPPDAKPTSLYLDAQRALSWSPASRDGRDVVTHDPETGSGKRSRWRTLVSPFVVADYPDRDARGRALLTYRSAPLADDVEIAGHPLVELHLRADAADGAVFAYLEEETAAGVHYVTEGALRLIHRELDRTSAMFTSPAPYRSYLRGDARPMPTETITRIVFDLLPVAYRFARGSRIRLALATADADHFAPVPDAAKVLTIERTSTHPSALVLPIRAGN